MKSLKVIWILILVLIIVWGCDCGRPEAPALNKNLVPQFKGESFQGKKFTERDLRGKITALSFVNSWCDPCLDEIASLNTLNDSVRIATRDFAALCLTYESKEEFDSLYEEVGFFNLVVHPRDMGRVSRMPIIENLISYIKGYNNVWFATYSQVADLCLKQLSEP